MEQALAAGTADQCWMLMQYSSSSTMNTSSSSSSWEEKAFAEDAAGHGPLGGCVWPPRSYSCSFCMREFRSAQALGGHMNVHRRDRARLKQCHLNSTTTISTDHHHHRSSKSLLGAHQKCPNFSSSSPVTRASSAAAALSMIQEINVSGDDHDHHQRAFLSSSSSTWSDSKPDQLEKIHMMRELQDSMWQGNICDDDYVETHLSVGLINSVVSGNISQVGSCGEEARSYKRPKPSISPFPFFLHSEVTGLVDSSSMEDLDLELRLGDPPKVK